MSVFFGELPVGTAFVFRGKRYVKEALSMAHDEDQLGNIFLGDTVVEVEGELKERLPWKPDEFHWTHWMSPAPRGYRAKDGRWIVDDDTEQNHLAQPSPPAERVPAPEGEK